MRTPPRWLREHRRVARVVGPSLLAAVLARRVEAERRRMEFSRVEWGLFKDVPDDEWELFVAALEEAKGRPLLR